MFAALPATAGAEPAADTAFVTLSRHQTTNALDNPLALADGFTRLRGSLDRGFDHGWGKTRVALLADITRYDIYDLEDDASLAVSTGSTAKVADWLELRGTLSAALSEEGDEFATASGFLPSRTRLATLAAGLRAGLRVGPRTALVLDMAATAEEAGRTRFPGTELPSLRLEADRARLAFSATATHTEGIFSYGIHAGLHLVRAGATALLPAVALAEHTLKLQLALASESGHRLGLAAGIQMLAVEEPAFRQLRPTLALAAAIPLGGRLTVLAAASAAYDTVSRDDPVGAFVRRAEAGFSFSPLERLRLAGGAYGERRVNIGLGGTNDVRAGFAEARWTISDRWSARLRVEASRKVEAPAGLVTRTVETRLALSAAL